MSAWVPRRGFDGLRWACILLWGGALALAGCGGERGFPVRTDFLPYSQDQRAAREVAESARYHLRPGDVLKVSFKYEDDLDQNNILILPDGYINLKGTGEVIRASGLTTDGLDSLLTIAYARDYRNPDLSVIVEQLADREVYVLGRVAKPGLYRMPNVGMGVLQAVALAGGFEDGASKSEVTVLRAAGDGFMVRILDFSHVEKGGDVFSNLYDLAPYDIVYVPKSGTADFSYITQEIFGSLVNVSKFFWEVYAISNLDKIDRVIR